MRPVEVVVTHLELSAETWRGARALPNDLELRHEYPPNAAEIASAMYRIVGGNWHWTDRLPWTVDQWRDATDREGIELWTARIGAAIVGYFQLHLVGDAVELKYFGLTPEFTGRGIGGPLLSAAVQRAWSVGARQVTLNTCTLDHPAALHNYLAAGFHVVRTETERRVLPA